MLHRVHQLAANLAVWGWAGIEVNSGFIRGVFFFFFADCCDWKQGWWERWERNETLKLWVMKPKQCAEHQNCGVRRFSLSLPVIFLMLHIVIMKTLINEALDRQTFAQNVSKIHWNYFAWKKLLSPNVWGLPTVKKKKKSFSKEIFQCHFQCCEHNKLNSNWPPLLKARDRTLNKLNKNCFHGHLPHVVWKMYFFVICLDLSFKQADALSLIPVHVFSMNV